MVAVQGPEAFPSFQVSLDGFGFGFGFGFEFEFKSASEEKQKVITIKPRIC